MSRKLEGLKPERVFYYFEKISKIPRCSFHEEKISNYLAEFGRQQGFETIQDEALNVIIKKPGTSGYENSDTIVLQGHMDMVCEKEEASNHDFSKDPINFKVEGDFLVAEETTLGADNGIAVAMCLALLESKDIPHPPLEVLITSNEESGMDGAKGLDPKNISGKTLVNIDSEEEGKALVSCAGGERNKVTIPIDLDTINITTEYILYSVKTTGLLGGHSGMEIDKGRGNANKIITKILSLVKDECNFKLAHIEGGSKSNAIPRSGYALIAVPRLEKDIFLKRTETFKKQIQDELKTSDPNFDIAIKEVKDEVNKAFSEDSFNRVIAALTLIPTGVQSMSKDMEGLVESSNNLGVVKTEKDSVTIESALRSSKQVLKEKIAGQIESASNIAKGKYESSGAYPAWEFKENSKIREIFRKVYKAQFGEEIEIAAIHAGLECGLFAEKLGKDIDMISFGPNMYGVHAPGEKLSISSTERTYELLLNVLKEIK